jgi:anti-sigma B factor antagonist
LDLYKGEINMTITEKKQNDWLVLALADRLDTQTAPELEQTALGKLGDGVKMALDLSELQYISSAGLRVLLMLMKKAKASGGKVALVGVGGMVGEILEESGIDAFFEQYDMMEALP